MKRTSALITLCAWAMTAMAQEFGTHWIAFPEPDSVAQVWFRQTYVTTARPRQATVTVASTGLFELYVNQWNVSTDVMTPFRTADDDRPIAITYDVSRFLRCDSNVIAVWYSPAAARPNRKQISVVYSGTMPNGTRFSHVSDPDWLCRRANRSLTPDGGETIDGRMHNPNWNATAFDPACWISPQSVRTGFADGYKELCSFYPSIKVTHVRKPSYFDAHGDSVYYEFRTGFKGWVRVTLRDTRRGEHIRIGGLEYVCSGIADEQACRKFTMADYRRVLICGDDAFDRSQLYKVEGVELSPSFHHSYQY